MDEYFWNETNSAVFWITKNFIAKNESLDVIHLTVKKWNSWRKSSFENHTLTIIIGSFSYAKIACILSANVVQNLLHSVAEQS